MNENGEHFVAIAWEDDWLNPSVRCTFDLSSADRPCRWYGIEATEAEYEASLNAGDGAVISWEGRAYRFSPGVCGVVETLKDIGTEGLRPLKPILFPEVRIEVEDWDEGICNISAAFSGGVNL